ncbi:unnamed protein product [Prunus brigantina]
MSDDMEEVLERQERERRARMRRRAASKRAQRDLDEQLGVAVAMMEEENQSRKKLCWKFGASSRAKVHGCAMNVGVWVSC